jgi:hypothetical protein
MKPKSGNDHLPVTKSLVYFSDFHALKTLAYVHEGKIPVKGRQKLPTNVSFIDAYCKAASHPDLAGRAFILSYRSRFGIICG